MRRTARSCPTISPASLVSNSCARGLLRSGLSGTRLFVFILISCTSITPQPNGSRSAAQPASDPAATAGELLDWQTTDDSFMDATPLQDAGEPTQELIITL